MVKLLRLEIRPKAVEFIASAADDDDKNNNNIGHPSICDYVVTPSALWNNPVKWMDE